MMDPYDCRRHPRVFDLAPDHARPDRRPESPGDDPSLPKTYSKTFDTLAFEGVTIVNPHPALIANQAGSNEAGTMPITQLPDRQPRSSAISDSITLPPVIIGMNVLTKHLHVYMAFREGKLYVTPAAAPENAHFKPGGQPESPRRRH